MLKQCFSASLVSIGANTTESELPNAEKQQKNAATGWSGQASTLEWHAAASFGVINERQRTIPKT
jgi:hypothetical protein